VFDEAVRRRRALDSSSKKEPHIMPKPSFAALKTWAENYPKLWNAGDKQAWIDSYKTVAPGNIRMLDPVGTPEKVGFDHCCADSWDLFQPNIRFRIVPGSLFVCDNEVAWLLENHFTSDGREQIGLSIETYRFEENGDLVIRTYYKVPRHSEAEIGQIFQTYLPDRG
jgi:hypothetical protein